MCSTVYVEKGGARGRVGVEPENPETTPTPVFTPRGTKGGFGNPLSTVATPLTPLNPSPHTPTPRITVHAHARRPAACTLLHANPRDTEKSAERRKQGKLARGPYSDGTDTPASRRNCRSNRSACIP